ncbi:hypothetical protein NE237_002142 [Protea cynaroides]|uniref:Late embryogenesis abundant protein LEA-2 subgroup domain-containing protein n=1 Tax=Protea cynaroides TaxID=273540 RepID=A0A9Q0KUP0_9MAGN|nr:hypothetical protein NE237_002142 [Protea cynaroides]
MLRLKINKSEFSCYLWILQVIIVNSLSIYVIWVSTRPKAPIYTVVDFYIPEDFGSKNITTHEARQNRSLFIDMEITNPNKIYGINYTQMGLTFYHGDSVVGVSSIASFYQDHNKTSRREVRVSSGDQKLWEWASSPVLNKTVDLKVGLVSPIRYNVIGWKTRTYLMELQAHILLGSDGQIYGVIVLAVVLFVLLWFFLPPRNPRYTIIDFNVPALNTSIYSVGQEISIRNTTITFRIEIENPNDDYTISSDETKVTLYYGNDSLGEIPFKEIVSLDKGTVREDGVVNGDGEILQKAVSGAVRNQTKEFIRVNLMSTVRYKMWVWKSKHHRINMEAQVPVGKNGKISAKKKKVRLHRVHLKSKK